MSPFPSSFWFSAAVVSSLLNLGCSSEHGGDEGFKLCVTSKQRIEDLSGQNLTGVPSPLPGDLQYLDLSYNLLGRLEGAAFAGLSRLCFLKVTHCGLRLVSPDVFSHVPALKVLNVSHNLLSAIPDMSLKDLRILDLTYNLYSTYQIPASFQSLGKLDSLLLGSSAAHSLRHSDLDPLSNASLSRLFLGAGVHMQNYDSGALAKIRSIQEFSLFAPFCGNFEVFERLLVDLNVTGTTALTFITLFPDSCDQHDDPFRPLPAMPSVQSLTIVSTWLNSSFMEVFLKNVWLSSLYRLSFVNMTYNEDTPDGFQFHTLNHTINLHTLSFSGINHYQYRYPTFNISLEAVSGLTSLTLLISVLPSLETLDLSDNLLSETGFWWPGCSHTAAFPKLRHLSLSKNRFISLSLICVNMKLMSTVESLDLSFNSLSLDKPCSWPSQLIQLSLANNNLGNRVFQFLSTHFERLDLSKTGITFIKREDLAGFLKLTHLGLSSNSLQVLPTDLRLPALRSLHIDQNAITSIFSQALAGFPQLQTLKAGRNPFVCSCDSYWFVTLFNKSHLPDWPLDYTCSTPPRYSNRSLSEYRTSRLSCEAGLQAAVSLPVIIAVSAVVGLVFHKCDGVWYSKMLWVWIRMKRRGRKRANLLNNMSFKYHAFISYSHQDSDWVDDQLVPSLERAGVSLCVHERDFVPGEWIIDNIISCVESSYKTLFVLSKHFVQSEWCNYELFFAHHRAISVQRDSLVFLLLEPIPADSLPRKFLRLKSLLREQTYLEWPGEPRKQQLFWASLRSMLHIADRAVLRGVATCRILPHRLISSKTATSAAHQIVTDL
uniref:TIR domain-containing protein n=1 Tax=Salarias fasciatus TaxID=181472 RepID=A0A672H698_SALFA